MHMKRSVCSIAFASLLTILALVEISSRFCEQKKLDEQLEEDIQKCGGKLKETRCVVEGADGWLFLQESLINIVADWHPNTEQIIAFSDSLEERGIELVVVPVPDKLQAEADHYIDIPDYEITAKNYDDWIETLQKNDVTVIDALDKFRELRNFTPMFEPNESHCTGAARQILAEMVVDSIEGLFEDNPKKKYLLKDTLVPGTGNLYHLLHNKYSNYKVEEAKVITPDGKKYRGSKKAPIVVIGDSNAGHGSSISSNIGAYIAQNIGEETYTISKVGGGNIGPTLFKNREDFLHGKKAVVWVFDGRELYGKFQKPAF